MLPVVRQVQGPLQSEFSTECDLVLPLLIPSILFFLKAISSCLCFLPRLPVKSILPSILPSITCFSRQFLHNMWQIQLNFLLFNVCGIFLFSLSLYKTSVTYDTKPSAWSFKFVKKMGINVNRPNWIRKRLVFRYWTPC